MGQCTDHRPHHRVAPVGRTYIVITNPSNAWFAKRFWWRDEQGRFLYLRKPCCHEKRNLHYVYERRWINDILMTTFDHYLQKQRSRKGEQWGQKQNLTLDINSMLLVFQTDASWERFKIPASLRVVENSYKLLYICSWSYEINEQKDSRFGCGIKSVQRKRRG